MAQIFSFRFESEENYFRANREATFSKQQVAKAIDLSLDDGERRNSKLDRNNNLIFNRT